MSKGIQDFYKKEIMMKKLLVVLGCFWWGSSLSCEASLHFSEIEANKENQGLFIKESFQQPEAQPISKPYTVDQILAEVSEASTNADIYGLRMAYDHFAKVDLPEEVWQVYAMQLKAESWPAQITGKERVGAHIFFPSQALEWFDCPYRQHLVHTPYVAWGCYISAQFNHPVGKYLFAETLEKLNAPKSVIKKYYEEAISDLKKRLDHPDATYLLMRGVWEYPYPVLVYQREKTLTIASPILGSHPLHSRNKYYELNRSLKLLRQKLTAENCLELARAGYYPAYIKAGELSSDETEEEILKEAVQKGYSPALLKLGGLCKRQDKHEQAKQCFEQAAHSGIATGYIELGQLLIGDPTKVIISEVSKEVLDKVENYFRLAGQAKDPMGWNALIDFLEKRLDFAKGQRNREDFDRNWQKLAAATAGGLQLGLNGASTKAGIYIKESYLEALIRAYDYPPIK